MIEDFAFKSNIIGCSSCLQYHHQVDIYWFDEPRSKDGLLWPWWGVCPSTGVKILMRMEDDGLAHKELAKESVSV